MKQPGQLRNEASQTRYCFAVKAGGKILLIQQDVFIVACLSYADQTYAGAPTEIVRLPRRPTPRLGNSKRLAVPSLSGYSAHPDVVRIVSRTPWGVILRK